jgi:O-antigen/teichoic acid export membrane protein
MSEAGRGRRKLAGDITGTFATKLLLLPMALVTSVVLARALQPAGRGVYATVLTIAELALLVGALGIGKAVTYAAAREPARDRVVEHTAIRLGLVNGVLLSAALVLGALLLLPEIFPEVPPETMLLAAPLGVLVVVRGVWEGVLRGRQRVIGVNAVALSYAALSLVLVAAIAATVHLDPDLAVLARVGAAAGAAGIAAALVRRTRRGSGRRPFDRRLARGLLLYGVPYAGIALMQNLNYRVDVLLVQGFLSNAEVGVYTVATSTGELLWYLPSAVGFVVFPRVAAAAQADIAAAESAALLRWTVLITAGGAIALAAVARPVIELLYGRPFSPAVDPLMILLPGLVANCWYQVLSGYLMGRQVLWPVVAAALGGLVMNVALNIALIPAYGLEGAALASVVSYGLASAITAGVFVRSSGIAARQLLLPSALELRAAMRRLRSALAS